MLGDACARTSDLLSAVLRLLHLLARCGLLFSEPVLEIVYVTFVDHKIYL